MEQTKTPQEILAEVNKQIDEILKANNCALEVDAKGSRALGEQVMVLRPVIVYKGEK